MDKVYVIPGDPGGLPDRFFRYSGGSDFDRWDQDARAWVHVTDKAQRDYYLDRLETGDGAVPATLAEVASLH